MKILLFVLTFIFAQAAHSADCSLEKPIGSYQTKYAKHFAITYFKNFALLKSGPKNEEILITERPLECKTSLMVFRKNPLRIIATSTTHLPLLTLLGFENRLIGFQGTNYISNKNFLTKSPANINYQLNPEELLKLKPDLIFSYAANVPFWKTTHDYHQLNIPLVLIWDFAETHPLARAEWMVFQAHFFSREKQVMKHFSLIEKNYKLTMDSSKNKLKKMILVGDIQNGKWVTCGGQSDLGKLITDAGGQLALENNKTETQFMALEKVFSTSIEPQVWLSQNNWNNKHVAAKDMRYKNFIQVPIFNNNKLVNANGFNDFWETGVARPDLILEDLANIFHNPDLKEENLNWFKRIK